MILPGGGLLGSSLVWKKLSCVPLCFILQGQPRILHSGSLPRLSHKVLHLRLNGPISTSFHPLHAWIGKFLPILSLMIVFHLWVCPDFHFAISVLLLSSFSLIVHLRMYNFILSPICSSLVPCLILVCPSFVDHLLVYVPWEVRLLIRFPPAALLWLVWRILSLAPTHPSVSRNGQGSQTMHGCWMSSFSYDDLPCFLSLMSLVLAAFFFCKLCTSWLNWTFHSDYSTRMLRVLKAICHCDSLLVHMAWYAAFGRST